MHQFCSESETTISEMRKACFAVIKGLAGTPNKKPDSSCYLTFRLPDDIGHRMRYFTKFHDAIEFRKAIFNNTAEAGLSKGTWISRAVEL